MSFVHAIPLAAVIGLPLIPLALHLLTRQRLRTVELATFRFLFESYVQQRRRTQFLEALIAALRVLCVLGLVAVVARPVADRATGLFPGGGGRDVVLLIDCSASMGSRADGRTALDRARAAAHDIVARLTPEDRVWLVRVTGRAEVIVRDSYPDPAALRAHIDALEPSPAGANLLAALTAVFADDRRPANPLVYVFTDSQAGTFREIEATRGDEIVPPGTAIVFVDVGTTTPRGNLAVRGNPPARQRVVAGLPLNLSATVVNAAPDPAEVTLAFLVNDREVERQSIRLGPNETVVRKMAPYVPAAPGPLTVRFEIPPADGFPDDDRHSSVVHVEPKAKVLIVNGAPDADPFADETLYLRAALTTAPAGANREAANALYVVEETETAWAGLDEARLKAKLDDFAVVLLANAGNLHRVTLYAYPALRSYVQDGGGLIFLPGDRVDPNNYSTSLLRTPPPVKDYLLPVRLGPAEGDPDHPETFRRLARIDYDHPIFSPFQSDGRYFDRVFVKRRWPLAVQEGKRVAVLAEYADRSPAVVEGWYGDGRVLLFSFPANGKWTTLPVNGAEFVPLMLQAVNHVRRRAEVEGPGVAEAGGRVTFSVSSTWSPVSGTLTTPRGTKAVLSFERFGGRMEAATDVTGDRGVYTATLRSGRDPVKSAVLSYAVNCHPDESDPARLSADRVRELLPQAAVTFVDRTAEADRLGTADPTRELWRYVIYALFAVIAIELTLATLGGRASR